MELLGTILTGLFVALILATAVTFGFALIIWFAIAGVTLAILFLLREWWRRWMFLRRGKMQEHDAQNVRIIEVDYEDISNKR